MWKDIPLHRTLDVLSLFSHIQPRQRGRNSVKIGCISDHEPARIFDDCPHHVLLDERHPHIQSIQRSFLISDDPEIRVIYG